MRKILVFQHVQHKTLGILDDLMTHYNLRRRYINFSRSYDRQINYKKYHGLIILGGPMGVYEYEQYPQITEELELIRRMIDYSIPILGICLGAQLLANALGGEVFRHKHSEIGWHAVHKTNAGNEDILFNQWQEKEHIFQWHGDTFKLPNNAKLLLEGTGCKNQAFCYQDQCYGFQFHLESDEKMINRWMKTDEFLLDTSSDPFIANKVKHDTSLYIERSHKLAQSTFSQFFENFFNSTSKIATLGSKGI